MHAFKPPTCFGHQGLLRATGFCLAVLIFMALFVPTSYKEIKGAALLCALLGVVILAYKRELVWSRPALLACGLFAAVGLANSVHGYFNQAPGAIRVLTVMTLWPVLYGVLSAVLNRPSAIERLAQVFGIALVGVLAYSYLFLGQVVGIAPDWVYVELDQGQDASYGRGIIEYNLYSISSLLFLFPFWLHYWLRAMQAGRANVFHWGVLTLALLLCVLTGRRAVLLVAVFSPLLIVLTESLAGKGLSAARNMIFRRNTLLLLLASLVVTVAAMEAISIAPDALSRSFAQGFDFAGTAPSASSQGSAQGFDSGGIDPSASERVRQFKALVAGWRRAGVWFGAGNGSHVDVIRDPQMPWAYELTYVYLLFSTGIVGVVFYSGWFGWGLVRLKKAMSSRPDMTFYVAPMVTGVLGISIGAATNPYIGKFDYLWIVLLPHLLADAVRYQSTDRRRRMPEPV